MTIAENITLIQKRIAAAAKAAQRDPAMVTLVAVAKQQPEERIEAALDAGQRVFGENRVQEGLNHWVARRERFPDLQLHLIGPLQTNKAREAVGLFDVIHTLDRARLADALRAEMVRQGKTIRVLIQVNTGAEPQKSGVAVNDLPPLLTHCRRIGLAISGLMCIPPVDVKPEPHFKMLRDLAHAHNLAHLSVGMSADYEAAVAGGATLVRVGSGVFGMREL